MPNWKKLIVSGSDANLSNLSVTNAVTASYFKGDGSALTNVQTQVTEVATVVDSFTSQTSVTTFHNFDTKNILVSVYDDNDQQIIPASVSTSNVNSVTVTFDVTTSGRIVVAKGGHIVSGLGTASDSNTLNGQSGSYYLDYDNFTNVPVDIVSSSAQLAADISGSIEGPLNILRAYTSSYATTGSNTFNGNQIITGSLTTSGSTVSFLAHPWPTFGDESHIIKTQGYTASFNGLDRSYAYSGIGLDNFQSGSGWYNHSIVTYTYDNHDNPDYGGELNVGPTRTHMRQLASGSDSAANVSVNEFYGGETAALIYGDLIQLGAYRGNLIEIGNNSSTVIISGSSVKVDSDITASGHLIPSTTETYDLGTPSLKWRDLYISGGTIYLGDTTITQDNVIISSNLQSSLPTGTISSSAQIASDISGSFTALSSSLSTRLSTDELNIVNLQSDSGSFSARVTNSEAAISSINAYTGSLKNALNLDGQNVTVVGNLTVSGTTTTVNSTTLDIGDNIISLNGTGATLGGLSVNDGPLSGSLLWDGNANQWIAGPSGSEEKIAIASQVSGSFTSLSGSLSTRLTTDELNISNLQLDSGSFSTRVSTNEGNITNLQSDSGSFSTRVSQVESDIANLDNTYTTDIELNASSSALISAYTTADNSLSSSLATALSSEYQAADSTLSSSLAVDIAANLSSIGDLQTDSGSFSTRITDLELFSSSLDSTYATDAELLTVDTRVQALEVINFITGSSQIGPDISGSFTSLSASFEQRISTNETNVTDLQSDSGSFSTRITAQEQFSSSLSTTVAIYSGSFSGSFVGDGSQLSGVTSYTDNDTLSYINTLGVISGSAAQVKTFLNITEADISDLTHTDISALNAATSSYALAANISGSFTSLSSSLGSRVSTLEATDILYDGRLDSIEAATSSYALTANISGSFTATSSSFSTRVSTLEAETSSYALAANISGSFTSLSSSVASDINTKLNIADTGSFAKTNINNIFGGTQTYNNINVNGTASFAYIQSVTGSAKIIGDAFIVVNANTPTERYAGLSVYDSGSSFQTASLFFDGQLNDWSYEYTDVGGTDYGAVLFGPEYATKGSPTYPTSNNVQKGTGTHHLADSNITDTGTLITLGSNTEVAGTITGASPLTIKAASPYIQWRNVANTRLGYIQHNETDLVMSSDTGDIQLDPQSGVVLNVGIISGSSLQVSDAATTRTNLGLGSAATKSSTTSVTNGSTALPDGNAVYDFVVGQGYLTSYSETDTLATVTARGASTSTASTFSGGLTANTLRLTSTTDASVSSTGHAFQAGATNSTNIIIDNNEIMARNNGAVSSLNLNPDGGDITIHNNTSAGTVTIGGNQVLHAGNYTSYTDSKYLRSNADDQFTGNLTTGADNHITFGPNTTWGSSLRVGGNGRTATGTEMASVVTTDGNLHLDAADSNNGIYLNYYAGTAGVMFGSGNDAIVARMDSSGNLYKATSTTNSTATYWHSANDGAGSGLDADLWDGNQFSSYLNQAVLTTSGVTFSSVTASWLGGNTSQTRDKLRVWNDGNYNIGMKSGYNYGHLGTNEYAMSFQMNNTAGRGWWWGHSGQNDSQGVMSLTNAGRLTVATSVSIGEGQSVTAPSSTPLYVYGSGSLVLDVQGSVGQLFSVDDTLTGEIFAAADISGVPILAVNSSGIVSVTGDLQVTGDITAYYSSDINLKKNIKPIENPLEKLKLISGNTFEWDENNPVHSNKGKDVGVIAQEIEKVLPEIVTERRGHKAVQYEKIVALLIESNKALLARVEELESKIK